MDCWAIGDCSGLGSLQKVKRPKPEPQADEVLVKVIAAGLNYRDLMVLRQEYGDNLPSSRIPLSDGVGRVEAVGSEVSSIKVGDRVIAPHFLNWRGERSFGLDLFADDMGVTSDGWLAEFLVLPAAVALVVPDSVNDETAATMAIVGPTVWHAMVEFGAAGADSLVLSQGTGGVAIFALQLAKALGARFAITSSSDEKLAQARALGADYCINYRSRPDWAAALLEATEGRGADIVVDTLGFGELDQTVTATAVNGRIGTVGALSGSPLDSAGSKQIDFITRNITLKGIASGSHSMLENVIHAVARHGINSIVDSRFSFDQAPDAYRCLQSGQHFGKVIIQGK